MTEKISCDTIDAEYIRPTRICPILLSIREAWYSPGTFVVPTYNERALDVLKFLAETGFSGAYVKCHDALECVAINFDDERDAQEFRDRFLMSPEEL